MFVYMYYCMYSMYVHYVCMMYVQYVCMNEWTNTSNNYYTQISDMINLVVLVGILFDISLLASPVLHISHGASVSLQL